MESKTSTRYDGIRDGWQPVVWKRYYKKDWDDFPAYGGVSSQDESLDKRNCNVFCGLMVEEPIVSLSEAAEKIDPSHLAFYLNREKGLPGSRLWSLNFYLMRLAGFSQVSLPWVDMLKKLPLSKLIHVPLSHIPKSVYDIIDHSIQPLNNEHRDFINLALGLILPDWAAQQSSNVVTTFVELAIVLRSSNPDDALTTILAMMRWRPRYQGKDNIPIVVWILAQASHGNLSAGLYLWAHALLPVVGNYMQRRHPRSVDLIMQFVEIILSDPEAQTILVNRPDWDRKLLIPPSSFEILLRLTFPALSARVKATKRFEAVYPFLKEVAFAPGGNASEQIFSISLKLAGEGASNPDLAKEAASIAIRFLTENVVYFNHWDILYTEHPEASVALLRKLVDEWKDHSPKLSSLTVNRAIKSFRLKNEKAITEGAANGSLYKEADESCKLISGRLSRESACPKVPYTTAMVLATCAGSIAGAALALSYHYF